MKVDVKDLVLDILNEESDGESKPKPEVEPEPKPKPKKKKKKKKTGIEASTGSGRFSAGVNEAGALASENPKQLMKNLKVSGASGGDDINRIKSILRQAFTGTEAMQKVYTGLTQVTKGSKVGLRVEVSAISVRDGIKYIYHTMIGAQNAGMLSLDSLIQVENGSKGVMIYSGERRSW